MPNIENAWNYVCKSECNKALNEAIFEFEKNVLNMQINDPLDSN
jgi:hypothetical protein